MKAKRIWVWSFIFGILTTIALYFYIQNQFPNDQAKPTVIENDVPNEAEDTDIIQVPSNDKKGKSQGNSDNEILSSPGNKILPIEEGKRAFSIEIAEDQGVSGFLKAGDYVDVIAILSEDVQTNENSEEPMTSKQLITSNILLQNIKVLAISHAADSKEEMKRYHLVTLEVTPQEGLALSISTQYDMHLMLRNENDTSIQKEFKRINENQLHSGAW